MNKKIFLVVGVLLLVYIFVYQYVYIPKDVYVEAPVILWEGKYEIPLGEDVTELWNNTPVEVYEQSVEITNQQNNSFEFMIISSGHHYGGLNGVASIIDDQTAKFEDSEEYLDGTLTSCVLIFSFSESSITVEDKTPNFAFDNNCSWFAGAGPSAGFEGVYVQ